MKSEILTLSEAARLIDRSEGCLRSNADRGRVPCMRSQNGRRLFKRQDIEAFLKQREQTDPDIKPAA